MRLRLRISAGAGLLLAAGILASSACSSNVVGTGAGSTTSSGTTTGSDTTGSDTTACLPDGANCTQSSDCCNGNCFGYCNCMDGVAVDTCMCDGVAMGDCSSPGSACLQDGGPAEGGPGDGGTPVCQCMQVVYETPCP